MNNQQPWTSLLKTENEFRKYFLIFNLSVLIPLALFEIGFVQRFNKIDKLFMFTCFLYVICFTSRLVNLVYFSVTPNQELSIFQNYVMKNLFAFIQGSACLCLTYYYLIIEYVKITLESQSP